MTERGLVFECAGDALLGVLSVPESASDTGMVIIVGGPQYRAGSHRQFVAVARRVARAGIPVLRFDCRGMGDSGGEFPGFERIDPDVGAAIGALQAACPAVRRVVLWGLCDGAAAALLYLDRTADERVEGLCLLNPWVRSEDTLARAQVKHYYGRRLLQPEFWRKLATGGVNVASALRELAGKLRHFARRGGTSRNQPEASFRTRMVRALRRFRGRILLVLSGEDYTAKEFLEFAMADADCKAALAGAALRRFDVAGADHTFSRHEWQLALEDEMMRWLDAGRARA